MSKTFLQFAFMFVVLVIAQAVIFNHIALFSVALAFVFIYFILRLPISMNGSRVIALSFMIGLAVDVFADTPGMNSLAATCIGASRRTVLRLYVPRDEDISGSQPSVWSLGLGVYCKYVVTMSLLFSLLVFLIEALSFFNPGLLLMRVVASTLLTSLLIMAIDSLTAEPAGSSARRREKRL
ncbi:MAG: rod shape-determining protein MreD [Muribaculaceae bacterium]|nr:rod shape-determining protein MreD [Muribaculaceae bacterium]